MTTLPKPPSGTLNPLWMIFLFFTFTEVVLGMAVFKTTNGIQVTLLIFVLLFPTLIAIGFFAILWFKPENFYSPGDFKNDQSYIESLRIAAARRQQSVVDFDERLTKQISETIMSDEVVTRLGSASDSEVRDILRSTVEKVKDKIELSAFFTVDIQPITGMNQVLKLPIDAYSNFNELTDDIYFSLNDKIRPFHYGKDWILRNKLSKQTLVHARMITDAGFGSSVRDLRSLSEVGVSAGTELEVVCPE